MENTSFKVYTEEKSQDYGKFCLEPLERGYGDTLGNALRRLLLSSIRGAAVTAVKIDGVLHEFSTVKGVREDVIEILMNLKHIPIRAKNPQSEDEEQGKDSEEIFKIITLDSDDLPKDFFTRAENPGVITAHDMPWDNDFEFCGDGMLCTLEPDAHLLMEIYVQQGKGYLSAERERPSQPPLPIDAMLADAIFSPVKRVNYMIEPARVGQSIEFDRLILEVWTNGAVTPDEAVREAASIARNYFGQIADTVNTAPPKAKVEELEAAKEQAEDASAEPKPDELFNKPIHELELSIRSENCLLRGGIQTVGELLQRSHDDLLKIRNLGKKSLTEIEEKLQSCGYLLMQPASKSDAESEANPEAGAEAGAGETEKPAKPKRTRKTKAKKEAAEPKPEQEAKQEDAAEEKVSDE